MNTPLERQIHDFLVDHCGSARKVQGISSEQLTNLKQGKSGISTKKLKEVLELNGISGKIILEDGQNTITINFNQKP